MTSPSRLAEALADRYRIERELGAGGMATVWLAEDLKHHRKVAIKVLRPELASAVGAERFLAEIRIIANLHHPHILGLIDSGALTTHDSRLLYYVMPFVEGESLRARLTRETQLSIDEAVRIASEVGSALDYAYRHNVVHRDIKPENILLQDGGSLVADFGIALALQSSAAERLTETGTSIGTPQYMSPEQATGGKNLDARSDVYSLGVVLYEMLAGEPPFSGPTSQAVIAKLLTERPTRLRVVRSSVPQPLDAAVARALEKVPADRFASAAALIQAIQSGAGPRAALVTAGRRKLGIAAAGLVAAALITVGIMRYTSRPARHSVVLLDRTQITSTGHATAPSISADGKQMAYVTAECDPTGCKYGIDIQDVGSPTSRRAVDLIDASMVSSVKWSSDRRNFLVWFARNGSFGGYLVPALGGTPRQIPYSGADFYAGGDSIIMASEGLVGDTVHWVFVAALDGQVRDSIRVLGVADGIDVWSVGGSGLIAVALYHGTHAQWRVINRQGKETDHIALQASSAVFTRDAAWFTLDNSGNRNYSRLVRIPFARATGRFGNRRDTVYQGQFTTFDVTPDGQQIVMEELGTDFRVFVLSLRDAFRAGYAQMPARVQASNTVWAEISPNGSRLLVWRLGGTAKGQEARVSVLALTGGAETPLGTATLGTNVAWVDSVTIRLAESDSRTLKLFLMDARTGARREELALPDSTVVDFDWLNGGGWTWIPAGGKSVQVWRAHDATPRRAAASSASLRWIGVAASPAGQRLALAAQTDSRDTVQLSVLSMGDTIPVHWATIPTARGATIRWLPDMTLLVTIWEGGIPTLYRVRGPGRVERLGTAPRVLYDMTVSDNLRDAAVVTRDPRSDIFLSRIEPR